MNDTEEQAPAEAPAKHTGLKPARRARVRTSDIVVFGIILAVIALVASMLYDYIGTRRDIASAMPTANQVIADISQRDGNAVRELGSDKFKKTYTAVALKTQFQGIELVTSEKPAVHYTVRSSGKSGKTVIVVYKYPKKLANQPFYLSVEVTRSNDSNTWQLARISGSADQSKL